MMQLRLRRNFIFVAVGAGMASAISLLGGLGLEHVAARIAPLMPLIIALPGLNDLVGNYACIIAAHAGDPTERTMSKRALAIAIYKVLSINIIAIIVLSVSVALVRGYDLTTEFLVRYVIFVIVATCLTVLFIFSITHILDIILRKERINPDELLIPIVTSLADICMLLLIALAAIMLF